MANKNPLLSWLFGSGREGEPEVPVKQTEAPVQPETPPAVTAPTQLALAPDHTVNKLWQKSEAKRS